MSENRLLTKTEVASRLGVSEKTVDRLVEAGTLRKHPLSKRPKFSAQEIDRYLEGKQPEDAQVASCDATVDKYITAGEGASPSGV